MLAMQEKTSVRRDRDGRDREHDVEVNMSRHRRSGLLPMLDPRQARPDIWMIHVGL